MKKGDDVFIGRFVEFKHPDLVEIGNHVGIDSGFYCSTQFKTGDYVHVGPHCSAIGGRQALFTMEHCSGLAAGVRVVCSSDELKGEGLANPLIPPEYRDNILSAPVALMKYAIVSTNCVVFPGVTIGEGAVIGAGAIVTQDAPPWAICVGAPAKPVRDRPKGKILEYAKRMGVIG